MIIEKIGTRNTDFYRFCYRNKEHILDWDKGTPYKITDDTGTAVLILACRKYYNGRVRKWMFTEKTSGAGCSPDFNTQEEALDWLKTMPMDRLWTGLKDFSAKFGKELERLLAE